MLPRSSFGISSPFRASERAGTNTGIIRDMDIRLSAYGSLSTEPSPVNRMMTAFAHDFRDGIDINVGIGCLLEYFRASIGESPYEMQQQFVGRLLERGIVEGESSRADFTPCHIPVAGPIRHTARGRVLVAGTVAEANQLHDGDSA